LEVFLRGSPATRRRRRAPHDVAAASGRAPHDARRKERIMRPIFSATAAAERHESAADDVLVRRTLWLAGATAFLVAVLAMGVHVFGAVALVAIGAIGVKSFFENESHMDVRAPLDDAWNAVLESLGENGYSFGEPTWHGATEGRLRTGDTNVVVERHPGGNTRVRVRVGVFDLADNRRRAALLLESVGKRVQ
jgi:hypothetical protein